MWQTRLVSIKLKNRPPMQKSNTKWSVESDDDSILYLCPLWVSNRTFVGTS